MAGLDSNTQYSAPLVVPKVSVPAQVRPTKRVDLARYAPMTDRMRKITGPTLPPETPTPTPLPASAPAPQSEVDRIADAIAQFESGGRYNATGVLTDKGDRAYGKYQVMGANIPSWTMEALGRALTPQQFLADPAAQDAVAKTRMGALYAKHGNVDDVASVWFTGHKVRPGDTVKDANGTTAPRYVANVRAFYDRGSSQPSPSQGSAPQPSPVNSAQSTPMTAPPKTDIPKTAPPKNDFADAFKKAQANVGGSTVKDVYGRTHRYSHVQKGWAADEDPQDTADHASQLHQAYRSVNPFA